MTMKVQWQRIGLMLMDAVLVALALFGGYMLRFDFYVKPADHRQYLLVLPVFIAVRLALFWLFKLYRGILRYAGTNELLAIFASAGLGTVILAALNILVIPFVPALRGLPEHANHLQQVPRSVVVAECLLTILFIGGARFSRRVVLGMLQRRRGGDDLRRVLIVGAGDAGEAVARQMKHAVVRAYLPVAFADDDPDKQGMRIHGIPVAGATRELPALIDRFGADEVLIAVPRVKPEWLREIVDMCDHASVGFKILPSVHDVLAGRVAINQIRPVEIEDLLGRDPVRLELPPERNYIARRDGCRSRAREAASAASCAASSCAWSQGASCSSATERTPFTRSPWSFCRRREATGCCR